MNNSSIILIFSMILLLPGVIKANGKPKEFHDLESPPKLTISKSKSGWPMYEVESVKYHLHTLYIKPDTLSATYLIKEKFKTEITEGSEGARSKMILELWELGAKKTEKRIWHISQEADKWQFAGLEELVLIMYGCCDSPNKYMFYDLKSGSHLRTIKGRELPITTNGNN